MFARLLLEASTIIVSYAVTVYQCFVMRCTVNLLVSAFVFTIGKVCYSCFRPSKYLTHFALSIFKLRFVLANEHLYCLSGLFQ